MSPSIKPFNETKYKALMDGLECNEIKFSEFMVDNEKYRMDSEFYLKKYVKSYEKIKKCPSEKIENIVQTFTDFHANGSYETIASHFRLLNEKGYAYMVRTTDLEKENYVDDVKYITREAYEFLAKSKIYGGELLINKIGSPGRAFIMPKLDIPVSLGMNLFLLRTKPDVQTNESMIYLFFQTKLGKDIIERKINGTVPLTIDKEAIKSLYVPLFSPKFIKSVTNILNQKQKLLHNSNKLLEEAEELFLKYIDLRDEGIQTNNNSVKSFNSSFRMCGRIDAEYYQPKYDKLFEVLERLETLPLSGENGLTNIQKSIEPGSDFYQEEGVPFVRVSDVTKFGITTPSIKLPQNVIPNIESLYPKKDTILFSKDGTVGIAYKVQEDMAMITSGALLHLTVKNANIVLPNYLALVLNSPVVQLQAERDSNGAIIQHWKPSDIEKVIIPVLNMNMQKTLSKKVQESFRLRKKSKWLLDLAIRTVEIAIEEDEEIALFWLKHKRKGKQI